MKFDTAFKKACTQAEQLYSQIEKDEFHKLKTLCPILSKLEDHEINLAYMHCINCHQTYCQTTETQQTITEVILYV